MPEKTWKQRLAQLRSYPSKKSVTQFMERTVQPALTAVAAEFRELGYEATLSTTPNAGTGVEEHTLVVNMAEHRGFHYQAAAAEAPVPRIGGRPMTTGDDVYYKVEVFTQTGTEVYDLMGLPQQQVINDVLDRYEAHLSFLRYSSEHDYASVLTPAAPATVPTVADYVERIAD